MSTYCEAKLLISMRLPRKEAAIVQEYAETNKVSKTEALLHFLRLGIESSQSSDSKLSTVESMFEEILRRLPNVSEIDQATVVETIKEESSHFPAIKSAVLFGSFARDEATQDSDIDVRLTVDRKEKFSLYDLVRFQKAIQQKTGREVDVITIDKINNENLAAAIDREGIVVYERGAE